MDINKGGCSIGRYTCTLSVQDYHWFGLEGSS